MPPARKKAAVKAPPPMLDMSDDDDFSNLSLMQPVPAKAPKKRGPKPREAKETEADDSAVETAVPKRRGRPPAAKKSNDIVEPKKPGNKRKGVDDSQDLEEEEELEDQLEVKKKRGRQPKAATAPPTKKSRPAVLSAAETTDVDMSVVSEQSEIPENQAPVTDRVIPEVVRTVPISTRVTKNTGGASDADERRRLKELSRKLETLQARYDDLLEVGVKEAERNYEKLRKKMEEQAKTSSELVAELKEEVRHQTKLADSGASAHAIVADKDSKISALEKLLGDVRSENKNLAAKLTAARSSEVSVVSTNGKTNGKTNGTHGPGGATLTMAGATELATVAQMKEEFYRDLTGLIICGVKRGETEDVFDCLQTGRNGTLHFKLVVEPVEGEYGEEASMQCTYQPQLDEDRDGDLIDLLPEYLTDDIQFPSTQAPKFYMRISKALMEYVAE